MSIVFTKSSTYFILYIIILLNCFILLILIIIVGIILHYTILHILYLIPYNAIWFSSIQFDIHRFKFLKQIVPQPKWQNDRLSTKCFDIRTESTLWRVIETSNTYIQKPLTMKLYRNLFWYLCLTTINNVIFYMVNNASLY